jgi:hypothetical protein
MTWDNFTPNYYYKDKRDIFYKTIHLHMELGPIMFSNKWLHYSSKYIYIKLRSVLVTFTVNKKFWEELITYFSLIQHGSYRKWCLQQFFVATGTCLPRHCLATIGGYTQTDPYTLRWYDMDFTENDTSNNSSIAACICCCGNVFTELLPSNNKGDTHRHTRTDGRDLWNILLRWAQVPSHTY